LSFVFVEMVYFRNIMHFEILDIASVPSTNVFLFDKIRVEETVEGLVIAANEQTAGRGLGKNVWESEVGKNLTFSVLLKPEFLEAANQFVITQMLSLSVLNVLKKYFTADVLKVKWPNDIYVSDRKIAGILVQNIVKGKSISHSVVGIGINVNQKKFVSNAPNPVSIIQITNKITSLKVLLAEFLSELNSIYSNYKTVQSQIELKEIYLNNMYRFQQQHYFIDGNGHFEGKIIGVDAFGQLQIKDSSHKIRVYSYKEVEFVKPESC